MRSSLKHTGTLLVAFLAVGSAVATGVHAEDALRWKFKVGEKLDYNIAQEMEMAFSGGPYPVPLKVNMHQNMTLKWEVLGVDEKSGEAVIRQKFDHVVMKVTSPYGAFEYDSKSEKPPTGQAATAAQMYKPMLEGDFELTMTARGQIKNVKIPEEVLTTLKNSPVAAQMGDIATPEGFKKMMSQGALVLPNDPPKKGETWTTKADVKSPDAAKQDIETIYLYRYEGVKDVMGTTYAVIKPQLKMELAALAAGANDQSKTEQEKKAPQAKTTEQSSDGEVLFDIGAGRLHSSSLKVHVVMLGGSGAQAVEQTMDQTIDVTVTPSGEKKAEPKKAAETKKPEGTADKAEAQK